MKGTVQKQIGTKKFFVREFLEFPEGSGATYCVVCQSFQPCIDGSCGYFHKCCSMGKHEIPLLYLPSGFCDLLRKEFSKK